MDEKSLCEKWEKTLGPRPDWKTLSAGLTYKPAKDDSDGKPRDAASLFLTTQTLSGGGTISAAGTLSSGSTTSGPGTLSGGATMTGAAPGKAAPAGTPAVANYEIVSELGRGGMGVVYRAKQASLDREVALSLGDLGLAEAQVSPMPQSDPEAKQVREAIAKAQSLRDRAARTSRMLKGGLIGAAAMIIAGLGIGFLLVNAEQQKTEKARKEAVAARDKEAEQRRAADEAKEQAEAARVRAEEAKQQEEKQKEEAQSAKKEAETQRDRAEEARKDAETAREQEKKQKEAAEQATTLAEKEERESRHRLGDGYVRTAWRLESEGSPASCTPSPTAPTGKPSLPGTTTT